MRTAFFSMVDDAHYHGCRTDEFIESFKLFHPDIDLIIFREEALNRIFAENPGITFCNCKSTFAKKLYDDYDLVINMDTDHLVFDRMNELLDGDYDVAAPACLNEFVNIELIIKRLHGRNVECQHVNGALSDITFVSRYEYLEAGMIAGKRHFWDIMYHVDLHHSLKFHSKDMDAFNLLLKFHPFKIRIPNGHNDPNHPNYTHWYGCASMGREGSIVMHNDQIMLHGKPMTTYHFGKFANPKPHPRELFSSQVCDWIYSRIVKHQVPQPKKVIDGVWYY